LAVEGALPASTRFGSGQGDMSEVQALVGLVASEVTGEVPGVNERREVWRGNGGGEVNRRRIDAEAIVLSQEKVHSELQRGPGNRRRILKQWREFRSEIAGRDPVIVKQVLRMLRPVVLNVLNERHRIYDLSGMD